MCTVNAVCATSSENTSIVSYALHMYIENVYDSMSPPFHFSDFSYPLFIFPENLYYMPMLLNLPLKRLKRGLPCKRISRLHRSQGYFLLISSLFFFFKF